MNANRDGTLTEMALETLTNDAATARMWEHLSCCWFVEYIAMNWTRGFWIEFPKCFCYSVRVFYIDRDERGCREYSFVCRGIYTFILGWSLTYTST